MSLRIVTFWTSTLFSAALITEAQPIDVRAVKDEIVYLKLPASLLGAKTSMWGGTSLTATVEPAPDGGVAVNGQSNWRTIGFPSLAEMKVTKVKAKAMTSAGPDGPAEVELKREGATATVKLSFPKGGTTRLFPMIFAAKGDVESYRSDTYRLLAAKFFDGTPLGSLSDEKRHALVLFAHKTAQGTKMGSTSYKEKRYLLIDLGEDDNVYNELRMNQAQRVARVLNDRLLGVLKAFAEPVADVQDIYGLKLEMGIPHKSFADQAASAQVDELELYAPAELIKKFSEADITGQELVDGSVVIVNSNRVQVPLAGS